MAVDILIDIKGIKGESKIKDHTDQIDVLAWSWGMSNAASGHVGGGAGSGKVNVNDLSFTKYVDKASTDLMLHCCSGKHFDEATLYVRKAGEKAMDYLKIVMKPVFISSVSTGGSGGEDRLTENVTLNFTKVQVEYKTQDDKGKAAKGGEMGWDVGANAKL
jgi:type VI secretion system secreted protein Hcp